MRKSKVAIVFMAGMMVCCPQAGLSAPKKNVIVEVNEIKYRVQFISADEVLVFNKSAIVRWSLGERDNRLEAARRASGCETGESMASGTRFAIRLVCDDKG